MVLLLVLLELCLYLPGHQVLGELEALLLFEIVVQLDHILGATNLNLAELQAPGEHLQELQELDVELALHFGLPLNLWIDGLARPDAFAAIYFDDPFHDFI